MAGIAVAFTAMATTAGAQEAKLEGDLAKIQGKWVVPSFSGGETIYEFKKDKLKITAPSRTYDMTITLDEKAKPERVITFKIDEGPEDAKGKTTKGIYKFDNEKLILCFRGDEEIPSGYEQIGFEQHLVELKKPKD
jgi:uncharacterized protein (TIGR03067 family)